MPHLRWTNRPRAEQPVMIVAFEGWNDAGEAATVALRYLEEQWAAHPFAEIDGEEFYDFTVTRPQIRFVDGDSQRIEWPENRFTHARPAGAPDVVLLAGLEPQLRWRSFCAQIIEVASVLRVRLVLSLGALLAEVAHSRPTSVFGTADDPAVVEALHLQPSRYEGPTGIVGVLHQECRARGIKSASLWATVPSYVGAVPCPAASLALVDRVGSMLSARVPLDALTEACTLYREQVSAMVAEDRETSDYVAHLEEKHDQAQFVDASTDSLVSEVERFLREQ